MFAKKVSKHVGWTPDQVSKPPLPEYWMELTHRLRGLVLSSFFPVYSAMCRASVQWGCSATMPHCSPMPIDIQEMKVYLLRRILIGFHSILHTWLFAALFRKSYPWLARIPSRIWLITTPRGSFFYVRGSMIEWPIDYNRTYTYSVVGKYIK
jgi:hypothetical protein